ncbi:MAG: hypothetical protein ING19_17325 [Azospirillum sp.]|nr:hypothetical protein [Azospirillum sp.]
MTTPADLGPNFSSHRRDSRRGFAFPDLVVDVEASSLHDGYPIEIAIADIAAGRIHAWLIRPHASWAGDDWSPQSEKIHGLSKADIEAGEDASTVGKAMLDAAGGRKLASDNPEYDSWWIGRLFAAARADARRKAPSFETTIRFHSKPIQELLAARIRMSGRPAGGFEETNRFRKAFHEHSAAGDAASWAAASELIRDPASLSSARIRTVFETWRERAAAASPWRAKTRKLAETPEAGDPLRTPAGPP